MIVQGIVIVSLTVQVLVAGLSMRFALQTQQRRALIPIVIALLFALRSGLVLRALHRDALDDQHALVILTELILLCMSALFAVEMVLLPQVVQGLRDRNVALESTRATLENTIQHRLAVEKRTTQELAAEIERREQILTALDQQPDRICRYRPDGTVTFANRAYCDALGLSREMVIGLNLFDVLPADRHASIRESIANLSQETPVLMTEQRLDLPDGERWERWTRHALFDAEGALVEIQAVGRDITLQRRAEIGLQESEARLQRIVEHMPVMVFATDDRDRIVMWNQECEQITGYSAEEMLNAPDPFALLYPDPAYRAQLRETFAALDRHFRSVETTVTCRDGTQRVMAWSNVSRLHPEPGWYRWVAGLDITLHKQAEAALQRTHELLEQQVQARTAELRAAQQELQREIEERLKAELALRHSENQLRTTLEVLGDMVCVVDRDLRLTLYNAAYQRFINDFAVETHALGRTPMELFPFLLPQTVEEYRHVFATGEPVHSEEHIKVGQVEMINEIHRTPIFTNGEVTHVVTVIREVTDQRRAEAALRTSEAKFRRFVEETLDGVRMIDEQGRVVEWNRAEEEITGLSRERVLGQPIWDVLAWMSPPEARTDEAVQQMRAQIEHMLARREVQFDTRIFPIYRPDGSIRQVRLTIIPIETAHGFFIGDVMQDVTEQVQAEQALRQSEARLRTMIDATPDIICVKDGQGRWLIANQANVRIFDLQDIDYQGKTDRELAELVPAHRNALLFCESTDEEAWRAGQMISTEELIPEADGTPRYYDVIKVPLFDGQGARRELVIVGRDITERKRSVRQTLQLAVERERSAVLTAFVRDASHEFATPLAVLKNSLYLAERTSDPARISTYLTPARMQLEHLERLIESMLTMSRLDSDLTLRSEPVDPVVLLRAVYDIILPLTQNRQLTLTLEVPDTLPPLQGDSFYLTRAINEVLVNATTYTPDGGTVWLKGAVQDQRLVITVRDSGIGIASDDLPHIFERFYRADKARAQRGTGLGLPIAQRIVELHGGTITVESAPGQGSTFCVILPIPTG